MSNLSKADFLTWIDSFQPTPLEKETMVTLWDTFQPQKSEVLHAFLDMLIIFPMQRGYLINTYITSKDIDTFKKSHSDALIKSKWSLSRLNHFKILCCEELKSGRLLLTELTSFLKNENDTWPKTLNEIRNFIHSFLKKNQGYIYSHSSQENFLSFLTAQTEQHLPSQKADLPLNSKSDQNTPSTKPAHSSNNKEPKKRVHPKKP